jgi:ATP-dependent Clp protease adaptor protein ClpS
MSDTSSAVVELEVVERAPEKKAGRPKPKKQPRYNVILWDDPEHTHDYVIRMMQQLFGHSFLKGMMLAEEVDTTGRAICLTTTMEHAELKRDQIHAFGKDPLSMKSTGSMKASIEPVPGE